MYTMCIIILCILYYVNCIIDHVLLFGSEDHCANYYIINIIIIIITIIITIIINIIITSEDHCTKRAR